MPPNRVILSVAKNLASIAVQPRFFAALRMTWGGTPRALGWHALSLSEGRGRAEKPRPSPEAQSVPPNRVILSAAKNLASVAVQPRFFAALRMTWGGTPRAIGWHALSLSEGRGAAEKPRPSPEAQSVPPNRVILSVAKNLASIAVQPRFFAALRMTWGGTPRALGWHALSLSEGRGAAPKSHALRLRLRACHPTASF